MVLICTSKKYYSKKLLFQYLFKNKTWKYTLTCVFSWTTLFFPNNYFIFFSLQFSWTWNLANVNVPFHVHECNLCGWPKRELVTQLDFPSKTMFCNSIEFPMTKKFKNQYLHNLNSQNSQIILILFTKGFPRMLRVWN
jgi:hypothetical protein